MYVLLQFYAMRAWARDHSDVSEAFFSPLACPCINEGAASEYLAKVAILSHLAKDFYQ